MALPGVTISTSVLNVDCSGSGKIVYLPPASTIQGVSFWIRDGAGTCSQTNSIFISTTGLDRLDIYASTLRLSTAYQSVRCVPWQSTQYAIVQNFTQALSPFLAQFVQNLRWQPRESSRVWSSVAISANGMIQAATVQGGQIYISQDQGLTWVNKAPTTAWTGIAMSSDGVNLVACTNGDRLYLSSDTGENWIPREGFKSWTSVSSSSDGSVLLAGATSDFLYVSTNSGVNWSAVNISANYVSVSCSSDGSIMYAVVSGGTIYVSTDTGVSWTARDSSRNWTGITCSSDGTIAFATEGIYIYKSTDTGVSWTPNLNFPGSWRAISCSSDASIVTALNSSNSRIFFSGTQGANYIISGDPATYQSVAVNSVGNIGLAAANPGTLYVGILQLL